MTHNDNASHLRMINSPRGGQDMHPLIGEWALWQSSGRRTEKTIHERTRTIQKFLTDTGVDPLTAGPMDIARWISQHPQWGQSTAATYYSYLMSWHKWLVMMEHRTGNPMHKLQTPRRPERSPRPVADDELARLFSLPVKHRTRGMLLLGALAGLRVSEIAKVRGEDIDLAAGRIHIVGKSGKRAWVPLHPMLADYAQSMPTSGWWFPGNSRRPGLPIRSKSVSDVITNAMRRANVRGTPHSLRHWYATTLLEEGADLRTVQELMRHSSVQTTQVYTKVPDARRSQAIGRLDPFRAA